MKKIFVGVLAIMCIACGCSNNDNEQVTSSEYNSETKESFVAFEERETCHVSDFPDFFEIKEIDETQWGMIRELTEDSITFEVYEKAKLSDEGGKLLDYVYESTGRNTYKLAESVTVFAQFYTAEAYIKIGLDEIEFYMSEYAGSDAAWAIQLNENEEIIGLYELYLDY